jgi:hypothetical protein
MNTDYLNVNEILDFTTLSKRQIRNNIIFLRKDENFHNLIKGGGKGKGGKYWIHYSIIPYITGRQRNSLQKSIKSTYNSRNLSEFIFKKINWDYFGCIKPNTDLDLTLLIESLNKYQSFYSIHRTKEMNHIHFSIKSPLSLHDIKKELSCFFSNNSISIDEVYLVDFNPQLRTKSLDYLLRRGNYNHKKDLIHWGLTLPQCNKTQLLH